jgi:DNA polymerase III alpha subunit
VKIDPFGRVEITESEAFLALYSNKISTLSNVFLDNIDSVNQYNLAIDLNADQMPKLSVLPVLDSSCEEFDLKNQKDWSIPEEYKKFPLFDWLYDQCSLQEEKDRLMLELELFKKHNMIDVLYCLKYLVDTMRKHKIVWGVGRGSSVASFTLYLIGVHKINPLKYNLDIFEFLK